MTALLIKNLPDELHRKLKERAARNRRSMTNEALVLLEQALTQAEAGPAAPPIPYRGRFLINDEWLNEAKSAGRS